MNKFLVAKVAIIACLFTAYTYPMINVRALREQNKKRVQQRARANNIHWQIKCGNLERVKELVEKDSNNLEIKSNLKNTPLATAVGEGKIAIVRYLLQQGADLKVQEEDGSTLLLYTFDTDVSTPYNRDKIAKLLLCYGARKTINMVTLRGDGSITALFEEQNYEKTKIFAEHGASLRKTWLALKKLPQGAAMDPILVENQILGQLEDSAFKKYVTAMIQFDRSQDRLQFFLEFIKNIKEFDQEAKDLVRLAISRFVLEFLEESNYSKKTALYKLHAKIVRNSFLEKAISETFGIAGSNLFEKNNFVSFVKHMVNKLFLDAQLILKEHDKSLANFKYSQGMLACDKFKDIFICFS